MRPHYILRLLLCSAVLLASTMVCTPLFAAVAQQKASVSSAQPVVSHDDSLSDLFDSARPADTKVLRKDLTIEDSVIEQQESSQKKIAKIPFAIRLMPQTYLLPYYYTGKPYQSVYSGQTPADQPIQRSEFKAKLGLQLPLWSSIFHSRFSLYGSYQQQSYWQFYAKSQFFRETNYEPAVYLQSYFLKNATWQLGVVHQSNGRGGELERSWNRAYFDLRYSGRHWLFSLKPWMLIFKSDSSDLHNPDIADYLGYGRALVACHFYHQTLSFMMRNVAESGFKRGAIEASWSFPLPFMPKSIRGFAQIFSGYGQSLLEYDHYTNSGGVGIILSDWI